MNWKSVESKLEINWNQLKVNWKSIQHQLKIIEINWLHRIQDRKLENIHIKEDPKIVLGEGGGRYTNQDPTLINNHGDQYNLPKWDLRLRCQH